MEFEKCWKKKLEETDYSREELGKAKIKQKEKCKNDNWFTKFKL